MSKANDREKSLRFFYWQDQQHQVRVQVPQPAVLPKLELISRTGTHLPFPTNTIKAFIHLFMHLKRYVRIDLGTAQTVYVHFICNLMGVCVPWQWLGYCLLFIFYFYF